MSERSRVARRTAKQKRRDMEAEIFGRHVVLTISAVTALVFAINIIMLLSE